MKQEKECCGRLRFSPVQNRVITTSLTMFSTLVLGVLIIGMFLILLRALGLFFHIVGPVIVAFYLSLLTRPWYSWLYQKTHERKGLAALLFSLSVLIPITAVVFFLGSFLVGQGASLIRELPSIVTKTHNELIVRLPELSGFFDDLLVNVKSFFAPDGGLAWDSILAIFQKGVSVSGTMVSFGSATLLWLLTFFYWIIFVMQPPLTGKALAYRLPFLHNGARETIARYFHNFNDIIVSYFRGQIIDVTLQGCMYGTAFLIAGLPFGFIIGFVLGLLNLVPYLGVISGLCVALPVAFVHGGLGFTVLILAIFCVIQTFDGYVMQPYIQGDRMKLSAWQIVFALLFWTQLGGFLGLLLAIPLTAFVKASWDEWLASSERFTDNTLTSPEEIK